MSTALPDPALARRLNNIRHLLTTLNEIYELPAPRSSRELMAGPAPSKRVPCTFCHRTGKAYWPSLQRVAPCPVCDGVKWRARRPGEPAWDEATGQLVSTVETRKPEPMSPHRLEAEIARLNTSLKLSSGEIDPEEKEHFEKARERRDKEASYRELERVLDLMQIEFPAGRSAINSAYLGAGFIPPSIPPSKRAAVPTGPWLSPALDYALICWISDRMRGAIRIPRVEYQAQQEALREECKRLLKAGISEDSVKDELGVGKRFVRTVSSGILPVSNDRLPAPI